MAIKRDVRKRSPTRGDGGVRKKTPTQRTARLPRAERERHIVQEAIKFFAEVGFGGDTRELAKRLNVTHPLLFRYFPSKDALIERVYQEVYIGRWNPYWELIIADRSLPIRARMVQFYKLYAKTILAYEWVRLFMFSGLKGADMNRRWFALVGERIVTPICREIRTVQSRRFDRGGGGHLFRRRGEHAQAQRSGALRFSGPSATQSSHAQSRNGALK
jgi:AcrR family transcriptional regulator